uniref:Uncharacterized protein n=1 Tax=Alexandrium monilatum TaxID=311494 RepID=A0A7S4UXC1_9DINO
MATEEEEVSRLREDVQRLNTALSEEREGRAREQQKLKERTKEAFQKIKDDCNASVQVLSQEVSDARRQAEEDRAAEATCVACSEERARRLTELEAEAQQLRAAGATHAASSCGAAEEAERLRRELQEARSQVSAGLAALRQLQAVKQQEVSESEESVWAAKEQLSKVTCQAEQWHQEAMEESQRRQVLAAGEQSTVCELQEQLEHQTRMAAEAACRGEDSSRRARVELSAATAEADKLRAECAQRLERVEAAEGVVSKYRGELCELQAQAERSRAVSVADAAASRRAAEDLETLRSELGAARSQASTLRAELDQLSATSEEKAHRSEAGASAAREQLSELAQQADRWRLEAHEAIRRGRVAVAAEQAQISELQGELEGQCRQAEAAASRGEEAIEQLHEELSVAAARAAGLRLECQQRAEAEEAAEAATKRLARGIREAAACEAEAAEASRLRTEFERQQWRLQQPPPPPPAPAEPVAVGGERPCSSAHERPSGARRGEEGEGRRAQEVEELRAELEEFREELERCEEEAQQERRLNASLQDAASRTAEQLQAQAMKQRELEARLAGDLVGGSLGAGVLGDIARATARCLRRDRTREPARGAATDDPGDTAPLSTV